VRSALHEHRRRNGLVEHATPLRVRTYTNRTTTQIPIRTSGHRIVEPRGAIDVSSGCVRRRKATGGTAVHANTCVVRETPKEHQRCRHAYLFTCQGTGYLHRLTTIPSSITSSPKHQLYKRTIVFVRSGREEKREMSQRTKPPAVEFGFAKTQRVVSNPIFYCGGNGDPSQPVEAAVRVRHGRGPRARARPGRGGE
jgi:hypothetical protein